MSTNMHNITRATGLSIIPKEKKTMENSLKELLQEARRFVILRWAITEGIRRRRTC
jgi:hypothetical protein